ncbi:calcium-binding protein 8 isoform 1-T1 [Spinachia spinachia]
MMGEGEGEREGEREGGRERAGGRGAREEPLYLLLSLLKSNHGVLGNRCRCCGTSPHRGGSRTQSLVDRQRARGGVAASESLMEEEVTEPDPRTVAPLSSPGTHSEVNGDLPGNPREDVMEPLVLQDPAAYTHHCGEKMPFHHVTAGLLYKRNYLSRSLSDSDSDMLASITVEELDGDGQVDFEEFMTILGPKLLSSETREGFLGSTIDTIFWQFDMQRITLEELKHILFYAFRDHLTMKDIENIIINEEESLKENSGNCQTEFEGVHPSKKNRQTCVRKSLICAFAMAFIISVMLIAANQMLRNGME